MGQISKMHVKAKETIYKGFYTFRKLLLEQDGETFEREQFESGDAAAALVYDTQQDKYILVKQYRYSAERVLLETVAGVVEDGDPEQTIRKEIAEETGYQVDRLEHIWDFFTSPGACTELVHLFYAEVSRKKGKGGGLDEEHEQVKVVALTEEELLHLELRDAKTIIALQWLAAQKQVQLKHPETSIKR